MATATVDVPYLSRYLSLPQATLSTLVDEPTKDFVISVLQAIIKKAKEHDEIKAEKLRLEVELENAVRTADSKIRGLKSNLDKALGDVEQLRGKLTREENARNELEAQLQSIKSSATNAQSELQALRSRISSLESSNRDTVSLLEAKSSAHDRLAEELSTQHQKIVELRRQISELERSLQAASAASTTAKFRESSLQQELELLKRNNEWLEGELRTKSAENSKSRKEKNAKISELQRQNDEARSNIDSLKRTEAALRTRLEEVQQKADQSFAKIQQLQDEASRKQEDFRKELESAQRLAELFEASANTARDRLQEVQTSLEQTKDEAAEEIGRVRAEVDSERAEKEAAQHRAMELEVQIERLEADLANMPTHMSLPGTPQRRVNGSLTPGRDVRGSPGASRLKGNLNFTQMYSEYTNTKADLEVERRRNAQMTTIIDEMIQDLESKQPEIEELRKDHERLEAEMMEMSALVQATSQERDKARKEARKWEGQVQGFQREGELLRQQLRDLSSQVKVLLTELRARDEGLGVLNRSQQMELERVARGELDVNALDNLTDTGRLITQRLTIFHNVDQLQEQNTKLLRLTRELGDRMEGDEAKKQQSQQAKDHEELEELRKKVKNQEDDLKSLMLRSDSYLKERDMFRRMLQHRGQLPPNSDIASPSEGPRTPGMTQSPNAKEVADLSKLLKEMQNHFDSYREEAATDHRALKEQSERLSREKSELQAEVARSSSQVALARERLEMLQSNFNMLKNENSELQKRSNSLAEIAAKQDLRTQQVAEDLVESKGLVDSLQKETANLKAEKDLWKRIEARLVEDNEALVNERNRLNGLITNLQNLQNERELTDAESRRKLQTQVENYTAELQSIKRKFDEEIEDAKKTALRREYEAQQSQKKIDDLRTHLASVKEELVAAQTIRDHLRVRVDELTIELRSAEERIQALQPRATTEVTTSGEDGASHTEAENERALSREQELSVEVAELKRDLELAQSELRHTKEEVEQYKAISQSSEEELQSLNETYEQYREEVDRLVAEKDARIGELEQTIHDLRTELSNATAEISSLNAAQTDRVRQADEERANFEAEITRLKDEGERHAATAKSHQEDLKAQAEIAQRAQQNYEHELLKHAEAAKTLQEVRKEHNQMKTEVVQLKTDAEAARVALSQNESSWEETKERYEREIQEMRSRRDDVNKQNDLLHKQLEAVTAEIAALRQQRSSFGHGGDGPSTPGTASDRSIDELREVITFLRRDKEIVDVQYELSIQESKRLKQQLDYTQSQLDECRLRLDQERRAHAEGDRSSMTHKELLQKINELNLYRESTVTLRNEAREAQAQLAEKSRRVEELIVEIQPLRTTIQELENEKETREGEMKLLQDDRDRWQQRTQNILQKYDRVDPAEMEALKEEISTLRTEHAQLLTEKEQWQPLKEQVESIPQQIQKAQEEAVAPWRERQERQVAQFKERSRNLVAAKNEKIAECQQLSQEKEGLERQLAASKQEAERANSQRDEALARVESLSADQVSRNSQAVQTLSAEEKRAMEERVAAGERAAREQESRAQALQAELTACQTRIAALELQIVNLQQTLDEANARVVQLQALKAQNPNADSSEWPEELEKLQQDLRNAQQEIDDLRTTAAVNASIRNVSPDDNSKTIAEQVSEQVGAIKHDLDLRHAERVHQAEMQYQQRADRMKTQLTKRLTDGKDQIRQNLEAEYNEAMEALKREHRQEIENLTAQHQEELDRLRRDEAMRFEQEKQIWLANNAAASSESQQSIPIGQITLPDGPVSEWNLPEPQVRELARVNPIIQSILRNNINSHSKKVKDDQEKIMEEKLKEVMAKAEKEKEQAVAMEVQRQKVKLSMAEGKARTLAAKTDLVQAAAQETPQRPVAEVWELAKVAKATPATTSSQPTGQQTQTSLTTPVNNQTSPAGTTPNGAQTGSMGQPNFPQPVFSSSASPNVQPQLVPASHFSQQPFPSNTEAVEEPASANREQFPSSLPSKPPQSQFAGNAGTGPGALRSILGQGQSMLPRGRASRGNVPQTQIPAPPMPPQAQNQNQQQNQSQQRGQHSGRHRGGRNRGQPRGASGNMQNNQFNNQLMNQLQAQQASLNATARQFTPAGNGGHVGNKRQRDDSDMGIVGNGGNGGKRPRSR